MLFVLVSPHNIEIHAIMNRFGERGEDGKGRQVRSIIRTYGVDVKTPLSVETTGSPLLIYLQGLTAVWILKMSIIHSR
jgi:hypothetical protein